MPENASPPEWIAVATLDDLWEGEMTDVRVGDEHILLVHFSGGDIRAYQGYCPHQKPRSRTGNWRAASSPVPRIRGSSIYLTGEGVNPRSCRLDRYEVKIEDGAISVSLRQGSR